MDKVPGGLAQGMSLEDIAKKHNCSLEELKAQLNKGIKVELEHTTDESIAKEIAMDHLFEDPSYYDKLATIEKDEVKEAKQRGKLYHFTSSDSGLKILEKNYIRPSGSPENAVSLTRNKDLGKKEVSIAGTSTRFVLDGDKLSEKYKIEPFNDTNFSFKGDEQASKRGNGSYDDSFESEERIKSQIDNIKKYIISVDLLDIEHLGNLPKYLEIKDVPIKFFKDGKEVSREYVEKIYDIWSNSHGLKLNTYLKTAAENKDPYGIKAYALELARQMPFTEAKQRGNLYHYTKLYSLRSIIDSNMLSGRSISLTRNKNFHKNNRIISGVGTRLVLDGDKLSENYKIIPFNDSGYSLKGDKYPYDSNKETFEYEERVKPPKGAIDKIDNYVISYDIFLPKAELETLGNTNPKDSIDTDDFHYFTKYLIQLSENPKTKFFINDIEVSWDKVVKFYNLEEEVWGEPKPWGSKYEKEETITEYQNKEILNPKIWDGDQMNPKLRVALLKIANQFYKGLEVDIPLKDILLIGSSANYNWTQFSDIDLHLLMDFSSQTNPEIFKRYFDAKKVSFNEKYNLSYKDHQIEVYVQDVLEPNAAQGIYSLVKGEWLKKPTHEDVEISDAEIDKKAQPIMDQIDIIIQGGSLEDITKLKEKIRNFRKSGLEEGGEYSLENLAFKKMRNNGYLEKLNDYQQEKVVKGFDLTENQKKIEIYPLTNAKEQVGLPNTYKWAVSVNGNFDEAFKTKEEAQKYKDKLERKNLTEAKQRGKLYHFTTIEHLEKILVDNRLGWDDPVEKDAGQRVSLTRNKDLWDKPNNFILIGIPEVRITLDGDKLSENYKIKPFKDSITHKGGSNVRFKSLISKKEDKYYDTIESEEYTSKIENLGKYILSIDVKDEPEGQDKKILDNLVKDYDINLLYKEKLTENKETKNPQDIVYSKIGKDWFVKSQLAWVKSKYPTQLQHLNPKLEKVSLSKLIPVQSGENYWNDSSIAQAQEYKKVLSGDFDIEDIRKENYNPILVDRETNRIIDGHHRHASLTSVGSPDAWVLYVDLHMPIKDAPKTKVPLTENLLAQEKYKKELKSNIKKVTEYAISQGWNIKPLPKVEFVYNALSNALDSLSRTGHYQPDLACITLYTCYRHPKDVLRTFSHELVHHLQNRENRLHQIKTTNVNEDPELLELEREAYEKGNLLLRGWENSKQDLNEAKQRGKLYHFTEISGLKGILKDNKIQSHTETVGKDILDVVSLTRDKNFWKESRSIGGTSVRIILDGDKLSENYKIRPFDYFKNSPFKKANPDQQNYVESEEVLIGEISNTDKYVYSYDIFLDKIIKRETEGMIDYFFQYRFKELSEFNNNPKVNFYYKGKLIDFDSFIGELKKKFPLVKPEELGRVAESQTSGWQMPSDEQLKLEFKIEHELKGHDWFKSEDEFIKKVKEAKPIKISKEFDRKIGYRSGTSSKEGLLGLIKSYRSYPEFRNEKTLDNLYKRIESGEPVDYPIVLKFSNGYRVFSGNTRMDIAFQLGKEPEVLIVDITKIEEGPYEDAHPEIKYWALYAHLFDQLKKQPELYPILKLRLHGEGLKALEYFYPLIKDPELLKVAENVTHQDLDSVEQFADDQLAPEDIKFSDHFFDRVNDPRSEGIEPSELLDFFERLSKYKQKFIDFLKKYKEIVAVDHKTHLNIPFISQANKAIAKTIMRKDNFISSNPKLVFEAKKRGNLYHFTAEYSLLSILKDNYLKAQTPFDIDDRNFIKSPYYISLTRNKDFGKSNRTVGGTETRIVIDGDKLSENYKIVPFNYWLNSYSRLSDVKISNPVFDESEERLLLNKNKLENLDKYVISYDILLDKLVKFLNSTHELNKNNIIQLVELAQNNPKIKFYYQNKLLKVGEADNLITTLITKKEVKEAKQLGTVYHFTGISNYLQILADNMLEAGGLSDKTRTISTTRDKNFTHRPRAIGGTDIGLILDGDALTEKYKVRPYDYNFDNPGEQEEVGDEQEEFLYGKKLGQEGGIKNVKKYIKGIIFTPHLFNKLKKKGYDGEFIIPADFKKYIPEEYLEDINEEKITQIGAGKLENDLRTLPAMSSEEKLNLIKDITEKELPGVKIIEK